MFRIRRTPVPTNTLPPHKGAPAFPQLLRGGLVPRETFHPQLRSQVQRKSDCRRSSLPAKGLLSFLVHATDRFPKVLCNRLFDKVQPCLNRETPHSIVNIKQSIIICLPVPKKDILQPISDLVSYIVANAPIPKSLKQYYKRRIIPCASRTPYFSQLLSDLRTDLTPFTLHTRLHTVCPCSSFPDILRPAPIGTHSPTLPFTPMPRELLPCTLMFCNEAPSVCATLPSHAHVRFTIC